MNRTTLRLLVTGLTLCAPVVGSATLPVIVVEPDDYADGTVLDNISPYLTLSTGAFSDNRPTFEVRASDEGGLGHASTGSKVFSHAGGIGFWNASRTFRVDFSFTPELIEIDYIASGNAAPTVGRLEAYSAAGVLLDAVETSPLLEAEFETLRLAVPGAAYALAYPPVDPFGDLDNLRITVPEPTAVALLGLSLLTVGTSRRRG